MEFLVILAVAAMAHGQTTFDRRDTPEVTMAKAAHYTEYAKTAARDGVPLPMVYLTGYNSLDDTPVAAVRYAYMEPARAAAVVPDTPTVAMAKAAAMYHHMAGHGRGAVAETPAVVMSKAAVKYAKVLPMLPTPVSAETPSVAMAKTAAMYKHMTEHGSGTPVSAETPENAMAKTAAMYTHMAEHGRGINAIVEAPEMVVAMPAATYVEPAEEADSKYTFPYADYYKALSDYYISSAARNAMYTAPVPARRVSYPSMVYVP